ncbi:MAG: hypothetical protein ACLP7Q_09240 [Isosphaeraceae bacterium]
MRCASSRVSRSATVLALLVFGVAGQAAAGPLNPLAFQSLGDFPIAPGMYTFNTTVPNPTLTEPDGTVVTGTASNGIAVFDFNSINVGNGQTFVGTGSKPLALLSQGDATINGTIDVSATSPTANNGPSPGGPGGGGGGFAFEGPFSSASAGGGPGGGGPGAASFASQIPGISVFSGGGGGGFGGPGGAGAGITNLPGGSGGARYGNLAQQLQGGSGGGGTSGVGGNGGGAIEIGAVGTLSIKRFLENPSILANGAGAPSQGPGGLFGGGGGGSGGGIFLHANSVLLNGVILEATGGDGGNFASVPGAGASETCGGGGGGGGEVTILYGPGGYNVIATASIDVSGGAGGLGGGAPGADGVITITAVPEPASLVLLGTALLGVLGAAHYARHRATA